jgi:hypothetical protein
VWVPERRDGACVRPCDSMPERHGVERMCVCVCVCVCVCFCVCMCVHVFVLFVEPSTVSQISPLTRYMIEVSRKAALHASSKRGNSTTITLTQVKRACIYLAAWQRAALPATTAATPAAASSPTPTLPGVPPPRSARTRRSSVRRPRTRRVRAVAAAAAGGGGGGVSSAGGGIADEHEAVTGEVG